MTTSTVIAGARQAWVVTTLVLAGTIALLGGIFWREALDVYRVWVGSTAYNHCFLVLPLVGYLLWQRRAVLAAATPRPCFAALAIVPFLSLAWLLATILSIHEAQQMIVLTILEATLLAVLGWDVFRRLMGPLLYLYFLVPSGAFLVPALQDITAVMTVKLLHVAGVPVYSDGIFLEIPEGKFVIAEACAGLRFLIASVAFGVFFALLTYRSWVRRLVFIALSVAVPILANALRAFGIVYGSHLADSASAVAADHVIYGWIFFSIILFVLILIGRSFADPDVPSPVRSLGIPISATATPRRVVLAGLLVAGLAALGPTYAAVLDDRSVPDVVMRASPPGVAAPWIPTADSAPDWEPAIQGADRTFLDAFSDQGTTVHRFVALYLARGRVNNLVRGENRIADGTTWSMATSTTGEIAVAGHPQRVMITEMKSGERRRLVISFFALDGITVADALGAKLHQLRALFAAGPQVSAFVAIAVDMPDRTTPPLGVASRFLGAMAPMPEYLQVLARRGPPKGE